MDASRHTHDDDALVHRLAAFTDDPAGGNPAGVVVTDRPLRDDEMQRIAAAVGYSETAFLYDGDEPRRLGVRYFAPAAEVTFCGHATIAAGVLLGRLRGPGAYHLDTVAGTVEVDITIDGDVTEATLTSVQPRVDDAAASLVDDALDTLGWGREHLDPRFEPAVGDAGARHLILVVADRSTLAALDYDVPRLRTIMEDSTLTTVAILWQESATRYHARNPFPVGGVVEDPATGAAAAAFGAYLRDRGHVTAPADFEIVQGEDMGRPSWLRVHVPPGDAGVRVTGTAVPIPH